MDGKRTVSGYSSLRESVQLIVYLILSLFASEVFNWGYEFYNLPNLKVFDCQKTWSVDLICFPSNNSRQHDAIFKKIDL